MESGEFFQAIRAVGVPAKVGDVARVRMLRGPFYLVAHHQPAKKKELTQSSQRWEHRGHGETERHGRLALRKWEDEEAALAGNDDREEAAVGRDGEVAKG